MNDIGPHVRKLHQNGCDVADWLLLSLANAGYWVSDGAKILDYGCGAGALVYRLRDMGYDAHGYDIHRSVELRSPQDERLFAFAEQSSVRAGDMTIKPDKAHITFLDNSFDLVISTSVFEHALDHKTVFSETSRAYSSRAASHFMPTQAGEARSNLTCMFRLPPGFKNGGGSISGRFSGCAMNFRKACPRKPLRT